MHNKTLAELSAALQQGEVSSEELTRHFLQRIQSLDGKLNAMVTVTEEQALAQARQADALRQAGNAGPMTGLPLIHKDIFCTDGVKTSCGSKMLDNFIAPYDATVVAKCKAAGMVMLGKANMDEFAMGSSNETSFYGPVHNPWDLDAVPGGSSGGSAAAVAARLSPEDAALMLNVMVGFDVRDSTSVEKAVPDYTQTLNDSLKGLKIGLPKEYFGEGMDQAVIDVINAAIKQYQELGAEVIEISLPNFALSVPAYYVVAPAECSSNLSRFDGVRFGYRCKDPKDLQDFYERSRGEGFGAEVKRRIMIGTYALSAGYYDAYYLKAQKLRRLISDDFYKAFEQVDVIMSATAPTVAFKLGEKTDDPVTMYLSDINTIAVNLAGLPGMSIPAGFVNSMPVGLQIIGNYFDEQRLLNVAHQYQQVTQWHQQSPQDFA